MYSMLEMTNVVVLTVAMNVNAVQDVSSLKKGWITKMAIFSMLPFLVPRWLAILNLDGGGERKYSESSLVATYFAQVLFQCSTARYNVAGFSALSGTSLFC